MAIDQLFVNPIAATLRKFFDIQFARAEHHFTGCAVDFIAVNVDIREVVVGADFLNLTQRILEGAPVPQPDILERSLIICGVGGRNVRLSGKFTLRDPVQSVGLSRQFDVVGDIGLLADQFVRLDDKAVDVPSGYLKREITHHGRQDRCDQPAPARHRDGVGDCDGRAKHERCADDKHPCEHDVRIGVSDPAEDRVLLEQTLEPTEIDPHCENQQ